MKKRGLLIVTLFTLLGTGLLLAYAGWFSGTRLGRQGPHRPDAQPCPGNRPLDVRGGLALSSLPACPLAGDDVAALK